MQDMAKQDDAGKENVTVRMDRGLIDALDKLAEKEERTRSQLITFAVREYLERQGAKPKK